jgi:predicted nucleotidyltransferase
MRRSDLLEKIKALQPELKAEGVDHVALFGSRARGEDTATSDVDLLVEVDPTRRFSLLDLIGVEQIVEGAAGVPAHALMRRSLDQDFAASIAGDVIEIF